MKCFAIDGKIINKNSKPYTIAEAGVNHNGKIEFAYNMITVASNAGADAIKFQTFKADEFCNKDSELYEVFKQCEFSQDKWSSIKDKCEEMDITFLSTPQNYSDLEMLMKLGIHAIKVGSDDLTNTSMLAKFATTGLPIILSCGMAYEAEIEKAVTAIRWTNDQYPLILMHCTSSYPAEPDEVNIKKLKRIGRDQDIITGYSDHTIGNTASILAVGYGAKVFETHFTLSNSLSGPDHAFSKNSQALTEWVESIHEAHQMLGSSELIPTSEEIHMREIARRSLTALKDIKKGEIFTDENIGMRRPFGNGLLPGFINIFGSKSLNNIPAGEKLQGDDIGYAQNNNE